jgi:lipoprotein-releasing system permease protein
VQLELELAICFLRRRSGVLLRGTSLAALAGVAIATAALVITLALMDGYQQAIATALQRGSAQMVAFSPRPLAPARADRLAAGVAATPGVRSANTVTYLAGLLQDPRQPAAPLSVVVKAADRPPGFVGLTAWPPASKAIPAVLGYRLAEKIGARVGDTVQVLLPPRQGSWLLPVLSLQVVGTFHVAFAEFDEQWIVAPLAPVLVALPGLGVAAIELEVADPMHVARLHHAVEAALPGFMVTDWFEMNPALFAALRWQTLSLFVVLSLVAAVASFQVSSALVVVSVEKRRTSGMLQALGATPQRIRRLLIEVGCLLGLAGVGAGIGLGWLVSIVMTHYRVIRFPPGLARVYLVESIPLSVTLPHLGAVAAVCTGVVVLASLWPARRAARLDPVKALRSV